MIYTILSQLIMSSINIHLSKITEMETMIYPINTQRTMPGIEVSTQTVTMTFPSGMAGVFISLFNNDYGEGYDDKDVEVAERIIRENQLQSLVDVTEPQNGEVTCTFIVRESK